MAAITPVVDDFDRYPEIFTHIDLVRPLDGDTKYVHVDYPTPLADRDYVARFRKVVAPGSLFLRWHAVVHPDAPPVEGVVRLERAAGQWELRDTPAGVWTRYTWEGELEGVVQEWIVARVREITGVEVIRGLGRAVGVEPLPAP